ncbi:MAG: TonB-dependent receptor [Bacteroidales bacterium]
MQAQRVAVKISGRVCSLEGEPLGQATVSVASAIEGGVANMNGYYQYSFQGIKGDSIVLFASYAGYQTKKKIVALSDKSSYVVNFSLEPKISILDPIFITAQTTPKALKDVPEIIRLITRKEIEQAQVQSLSELLELELPGLEFNRTEGVSNAVSMNGFGAKYVLFLIDGERMSGETSHENVDYERIDIDQVERVEIVKGGMSTLYGSGAMAGVVNIITTKAEKPFQAQINAKYSSDGEQKYGASIGFKKGKFSSLTSGSYRRKQAYFLKSTDSLERIYEDGSRQKEALLPELEVEGFENFVVNEKLKYRFSDKVEGQIKGSFYQHTRFNAKPTGDYLHNKYRDGSASLKVDYRLTEKQNLEFSYAFDDYLKYDQFLKLDTTEKVYENRIHNAKVLYRNEFPYKNHFFAGIEFYSEDLQSYQFGSRGKHSKQSYMAYVQDEWNINSIFTLVAGLRLEYYSSYGLMAVPKVNAMAKWKNFIFRLGYASGFRAPTLKEMYTEWDHQGMFQLMGNPDLKPELSYNFSFSTEYQTSAFYVGLNAHYHRLKDKIATVWNSRQDTTYYQNVGRAQMLGVDVNIGARLPLGFAIKGAYTYVYDNEKIDGINVSSSRPHSFTLRLEYGHRWRSYALNIHLNGRFLSGMYVYAKDDVQKMAYKIHYSAYGLLNMGISGSFPYGLKLTVGLDNLLNYIPRCVTYNAGITKGISFYTGLVWNIEELFNLKRAK